MSILTNIKKHITNLEDCKNRFYTEPGNKKASDYISKKLVSYGFNVKKDFFIYNKKRYFNLIVELKSNRKKNYIVCAHFDSKSKEKKAPGADDNASGVAAVLELSRVLKKSKINVNVMFAFLNLEEQKRKGSKHLARKLAKTNKKIDGIINLDTIGTWKKSISKKAPINYVSNKNSEELIKLLKKYFPYPIKSAENIWKDDHSSFWDENYKAIELTEDGCSKFIHTSKDASKRLHFKNIVKITNGLKKFFSKLR